jgi:sugar-specific transcriptional regulator TrmB
MKINLSLLRNIGLTESESKVYIALLEIGDFCTKGPILKRAKIAPSKVYHVLDKLMDKGLVSTITKNNTKHFAAASPSRIRDYIDTKKRELEEEEKTAKKLLPQLDKMFKAAKEQATAEIFMGWQGMETVYSNFLHETRKGETIRVLGASSGADPEKTTRFFGKHGKRYYDKGIKIKIIYNEEARGYDKEIKRAYDYTLNRRFLFKTPPVEILMTKDKVAILMLKIEPIVILIHDKETAKSFQVYFEELWKIAKR